MTKESKILAIESSCDETAASVVKNGREVFNDTVSLPQIFAVRDGQVGDTIMVVTPHTGFSDIRDILA